MDFSALILCILGMMSMAMGGLFIDPRRGRRKLIDSMQIWRDANEIYGGNDLDTRSASDDEFVLEQVVDPNEPKNKSTSFFTSKFPTLRMLLFAARPREAVHKVRYYRADAPSVREVSKEEVLMKSTADVGEQLFPAFDDPETVANFAKMTSNAYMARVITGWRNVTDYDTADGFGWDESGLRGYVFVNRARNIVIVSFKGTSILLAGGDTVTRDKQNDNMMFSCCCGRVDISWIPVCGCYSGGFFGRSQVCSKQCLADAVRSETASYFMQAQKIVDQLRQIYPTARLWFTGHSLGGAIANLMTLANPGTSSISFEAPGEMLYAQRLGLIPETEDPHAAPYPIWNFGVSTDPIYMGKCNGMTSSCYLSGYALETGCRTGHDCTWEREGREDIGTHRIDWLIDNVVLAQPPVQHPTCKPVRGCRDCKSWTFE